MNRVLVQIQMWFNDERTTTVRCKVKYAMKHVPSQMYKCYSATLLQESMRDFSTTELNSSTVFLQLFKCTSVVISETTTTGRVEDRYVIDFRTEKPPDEACTFGTFVPNVQISASQANHKFARE